MTDAPPSSVARFCVRLSTLFIRYLLEHAERTTVAREEVLFTEEEDGEHGTSIPMRPPASTFTRSVSFGCLQLIVDGDAYQQYRARQHEQPDRPCTACLPIRLTTLSEAVEDSGKEVLEDTLEVLETPCQTAVLA